MVSSGETARGLEGRTALVTGAARRIGRAVALALADTGVNVVVHYHRSEDEARETASIAGDRGVRAWIVRADLSDIERARALISEANDLAGRLDFLINNASVFPESGLSDVAEHPETFHSVLDLNAVAPLVLSERFVRQAGEGVIINLLDNRTARYDLDHVAYQLSKNMLHTLTGMMAIEYAPRVRVNAVAPGMVLPPAGNALPSGKRVRNALLDRRGGLSSVVEAVIFLLSNPFVTGEVLCIDGGENLKRLSGEARRGGG